MRTDTIAAFVALAATIQGVAATGVNWHHASPFKCPIKTPEICVPKQHSGLDWLELAEGKFEEYAGFKFHGFDCKNSFGGFKRDALLPRSFNQKCATAEVSAEKKNCPRISAKDIKAFSITKFQVSVEFDCELEFHYTLPNKSICKQKSHCKKSGTVVENTQCGGATDVTIIYPKPPAKVNKKTCKIGLHKIDFSCGPNKPNVPSVPVVPTIPTIPGRPSVTIPPVGIITSTPAVPDDQTPTPILPSVGMTISSEENPPIESTPSPENPAETPVVPETPEETPTAPETPEDTPVVPIESKPAQETHILTVIVTDHVSTTICPVTSTDVVDGTTSIDVVLATSTVHITETQTITSCAGGCTGGPKPTDVLVPSASSVEENSPVTTETPETEEPETEEPETETPETETPETEQPETETPETETPETEEPETETPETETPETETPEEEEPEAETPEGECPPVLPKCLNTWLPEDCASNSDSDCFCPKPDFTKNVYECLAAHGAKQTEIDAAVQYFQGLCAPFVPTNPGIIVDTPERDDEDNSPVKIPEVPVTTIILETTITVPCIPEAGEETTSSTVSTVKTTVTAPQVIFTTITGGEVTPVPGTATAPPAVIATPTNVVPTATKPAQEVPPYPTGPVTAPAAGPTAPTVPTTPENPTEEAPPYPTGPVTVPAAGPTAPTVPTTPENPTEEVPPYPTGPATAPAAGPTAPAVPTTPENPTKEVPEGQQPVDETPCLGGGPECPGNELPAPAPTTFVPVPVGTAPGSIGTVTKPSGPINTAPVFTGAGSKTAASGLMAAGVALALFL